MAQQFSSTKVLALLSGFAIVTQLMACSPVHERRSTGGLSSLNGPQTLSTSAQAFENSLYFELQTNCLECHSAGDPYMPITDNVQQTHDLIEDLGFVDLGDPGNSQIVGLVNGAHGGLSANVSLTIENAIQSWANQVNFIPEPEGPEVPEATVRLSSLRGDIFTNRCQGCHQNAPLGLNFAQFNSIQNVIDTNNPMASRLYQRITSDDPAIRMPRGGDPLAQEEIDAILTWITEGGQNN